MHKWSDGSVTVQIGDQHYEIQSKPLAPPADAKTYQEVLDSHQYLASPHVGSQVLLIVGKISEQFDARANTDVEADAVHALRTSMAAYGRNSAGNKDGIAVITNTQDPELQKKKAEMAERERMKNQRRKDLQLARADHQTGRIARATVGAGLSLDDLESGRRGASSGRKPPRPRAPRRQRQYSSDEDLPRRGNREDEYDREDDFLASSDEELEVADGDDDEEELLDDEDEAPRSKKRKSTREESVSDADADAEIDDDLPSGTAESGNATRGKRRNVIEDDEDDE
jgi:RNA polymerase-associated protein LEO1